MSQNRTRTPLFQNDRRSIDPYKASYKAARKEQEATPKEEQPAPPDVLTQERKRLLDEITQENEARERREKMAKESRENQPFEELSNQLQRPGNQAKAKGTEGITITVPNSAMKGWFAFPKGVSDDNLLAIEPSYDKVKIAPFTVRDGAVVRELQTITLSDLPSSVNRKK